MDRRSYPFIDWDALYVKYNIICPIRRLPAEILLRVFQEYVSTPFSLPHDCFNDVAYEPWLLSQVCHGWRHIILSSSSLWSRVDLFGSYMRFGQRTKKQHDAAFFLLALQLALSTAQPLHVSISVNAVIDHHYTELLNILLPHRHRWKSLRLFRLPMGGGKSDDELTDAEYAKINQDVENVAQSCFASANFPLEFSLLENIEIRLPQGSLRIYEGNSFPRLKIANLTSLSSWSTPSHWSGLEELKLTCVPVPELYATLHALTNLRKLSLVYATSYLDDPAHSSPIVLPQLEKLYILHSYAALDGITTPSLKYLSIDDDLQPDDGDEDHRTDFDSLIDMIQRSSCSILTLEIDLPIFSDVPLQFLLLPLTHLKTIIVGAHDHDDISGRVHVGHLSDALLARKPDGGFTACPLLSMIDIYDRTSIDDSDRESRDSLLKLIKTRYAAPNSHLKSVTFKHDRRQWPGDDDFMEQLETLRSRGLEVQIISEYDAPFY